MGNQMFQYAFGKLLEKNREVKVLFICSKDDFRLRGFQKLHFIDSSNYFISLIYRIILKTRFRYIEFHSCLEEVSINRIPNYSLVSGYFQSSALFEQNREFIRSLFKISPCQILKKSNDCTVHIRRGDYLNTVFSEIDSHAYIPADWFYRQIYYIIYKYSYFNKVIVVGDDPDYLREFCACENFNLASFHEGAMSDFVQLMTSKFLIISNSSFAWWAAFLNVHEQAVIIAPKYWVGVHVNIEYPKGIMNKSFQWR